MLLILLFSPTFLLLLHQFLSSCRSPTSCSSVFLAPVSTCFFHNVTLFFFFTLFILLHFYLLSTALHICHSHIVNFQAFCTSTFTLFPPFVQYHKLTLTSYCWLGLWSLNALLDTIWKCNVSWSIHYELLVGEARICH